MTMSSGVSLREAQECGAEADIDMEEALTGAPVQLSDLLPPNTTIIDCCTESCSTSPTNHLQVVFAHVHVIVQVKGGREREVG